MANRFINRIQVVPLTSNVEQLFPSEAYVTLRGKQRKAAADQITTVSKLRLREFIARMSSEDLGAVERAIRVQLDLA